jgi:hypothetical protein
LPSFGNTNLSHAQSNESEFIDRGKEWTIFITITKQNPEKFWQPISIGAVNVEQQVQYFEKQD